MISEAGASMLELKRLAQEFGLTTTVLQLPPDALSEQQLPLIARIGPNTKSEGHYVVVVSAKHDGPIIAIDGTSGAELAVNRGVFSREFSGYVLTVPRAKRHLTMRQILIGVCIFECFILAVVLARTPRVSRG